MEVLKHDSWAATALYDGPGGKRVCKFNRQYPICGIPMKWLGRMLARHEVSVLRRLEDLPNVSPLAGEVLVEGRILHTAFARDYIVGHPLGHHERVGDSFFPVLERLVTEMHRRNVAYVDMHKRENIIVDENGEPHLIDFQISMMLPHHFPGNSLPMRVLLRLLRLSDLYHLQKHYARCRPDLLGFNSQELAAMRPWWILAHRFVAKPLRTVRRRLLVMLRIRSGRGMANSEEFPEDALRREAHQKKE
ncbi:MAG: hypothetical protein HYV04_12465 [Deltaproteobacteria bacterium]|nr:hypothetical protein [Deltaproteobacteria bacterium]